MKVSRNYLNKPHRIYGAGANILKGAIFLGYSSPGGKYPQWVKLIFKTKVSSTSSIVNGELAPLSMD
jgi:hypothetical protein